ncbi:MAG: dUTP diphosphatase [Candidatus Doudnabacteria bacterium]|nr:dUTP diphosphatase [Candidatus Doudnabacteria bacterium]
MPTVKIKRFDKELPLPEYKTAGAAALDLYARTEVIIQPREVKLIPLNVAIEIPQDYFGLLVSRSSAHKLGITAANGVGIIDSDFRGDNDECCFLALNFTDKVVTIERGTRIAQILIISAKQVKVVEVDSMGNADRGGFGSTGKS